MIGPLFALALQTADAAQAPPPTATPAPAPPSRNAADLIDAILAQTPADGPPPPVAAPTPATPTPRTVVASLPPPTAPLAPSASDSLTPSADVTIPGTERDARYESAIRASFQARQARQGDLDGRWVLTDSAGKQLYALQLADPGPGRGPVEGAWRDLVRQGAPTASGFIDGAARAGRDLTLNFQEAGARSITLTQGADGRWTGQMRMGGQAQPVAMTR